MEIFVQRDDQQHGPYSETEIRESIDAGHFCPADLAWATGKAAWQPLTSLISLDVTKPPPIQGAAGPLLEQTPSTAPPVISEDKTTIPNLAQPERPVESEPRLPETIGGRTCKKCGALYKLWSPTRAMGSGLCADCSPKPARSGSSLHEITPISSRKDALKAVRNAGILYLILGAVNFVIGASDDPFQFIFALILWAGGLTVWFAHSRVAAVGLLVFMSLGMLFTVLDAGPGGLFKGGAILLLIQVAVTINATNAVFKLNNEYDGSQGKSQPSTV